MAQIESRCSDCGTALMNDESSLRIDEEIPCEGPGGHSWSDDDPLSRLEAKISATDEARAIDSEDNQNWQWIEIATDDPDPIGASELIADWAQEEGFQFLGIGKGDDADGPASLRFNKQKE